MISIIICTYNREKYIGRVLEALASQKKDLFELVLVDNNSTDGTMDIITAFANSHPSMKITITSESRQGLSNARNRGIMESNGDYFVFLDDDAIPCEEYVEKLAAHIPHTEAFGGRIEPLFDGCPTPNWLSKWSMGWVSALNMGEKEKYFSKNSFPIGANMGFSRKIIKECGMFNPELGRNKRNLMGGEEKDLFRRIQAHGHKLTYLPDVLVQHIIPASRTTKEYITQFACGVGLSEKIRSRQEGTYFKRITAEVFKWGASFVLLFYYIVTFRPQKGFVLILFRYYVTRNLI